MKIKQIILGLLLGSMVGVSFAHGPTPQKVVASVEINKPLDFVWSKLKSFDGYSSWNYYAKTVVVKKTPTSVIRGVSYRNGVTAIEQFKIADEERKLVKWNVIETSMPLNDLGVSIVLTKEGLKTKVEMTSRFYRKYMQNPPIPEGQDEAAAIAAVNEYTKNILNSAKSNIEKAK